MAAVRPAAAPRAPHKAQRELEDLQLVVRARNGDEAALDALIRRYTGFVRLKASSYFLAGGDALQARAAEHLCLVQPYPRRTGRGRRLHPGRRAAGAERQRPFRLRDLDRGASEPRLLSRDGLVEARGGCTPAVPGGLVLRGDGRRARLRYEDDRQRPSAREAEDHRAPALAPGSELAFSPTMGRAPE